MAKILGKSGRYVSEQATRKRNAMWVCAAVAIAALGAIWGVMIGSSLRIFLFSPVQGCLLSLVLLLAMCFVGKWAFRRMDELERVRDRMLSGAVGEERVGLILQGLPEEFHVINDLPLGKGNLDHVVIGPTGVYVIETKNWRGIVRADGKGELTWNGGTLKTPYASDAVGRAMEVRERVQALAPEVGAYFQAVVVFTSAWVGVKFGETGKAHCMRDNRLRRYLLDGKGRLAKAEGEVIARAFAALAQMHPECAAEVAQQEKGSEAIVALPGVRAAWGPLAREVGGPKSEGRT